MDLMCIPFEKLVWINPALRMKGSTLLRITIWESLGSTKLSIRWWNVVTANTSQSYGTCETVPLFKLPFVDGTVGSVSLNRQLFKGRLRVTSAFNCLSYFLLSPHPTFFRLTVLQIILRLSSSRYGLPASCTVSAHQVPDIPFRNCIQGSTIRFGACWRTFSSSSFQFIGHLITLYSRVSWHAWQLHRVMHSQFR